MPLWKLEPINLDNHNWGSSAHKSEVIVRAEDLGKARDLAARAYGVKIQARPDETAIISPWENPGLVKTSQVQASDDYAEDGDQEIVYPAEAVSLARPGYNAA